MKARLVTASALAALLLFACGCGGTRAIHELSDHYVLEEIGPTLKWRARSDLYAKQPDGQLVFLGCFSEHWAQESPFGFEGLTSHDFAISEDGTSIVYRHWHGPHRGKERGIYHHEYGKGDRRLERNSSAGASRWPKPVPPGILPIGGGEAYTARGELTDLALLEGTAVHAAALVGDVERIKELVETGEAFDALNYWGHEPIELAIPRGQDAAAQQLYALGGGRRAGLRHVARLAASYKLPGILDSLLAGGVDANDLDAEGRTILFAAIQPPGAYLFEYNLVVGEGNSWRTAPTRTPDTVKVALRHGCDPGLRDSKGRTAAEWLEEDGPYWAYGGNQIELHNAFRDELLRMIEDGAE